jgi:CheY-like chemotaxis protein
MSERRVLPRPQRILVADDSPDVREVWNLWLTFWGFVVDEAGDGAEALRKARSFAPHIVLMDMCMPVVNGFRATEQLKADPATARIPVLALSADVFPSAPQRAVDAGCEAFLAKPVSPDHLLREIRATLRRVNDRRAADRPGGRGVTSDVGDPSPSG